MSAVQLFNNAEFGQVRIVDNEGQPYFVAADVAKVLGYSNPSDATQKHCRCIAKHDIPHPQNPDKDLEVTIIPESDVYRLIIRSKLPAAERFERWVVEEVLPSIRKHGAYMTQDVIEDALLNPDTLIRLATNLKEEREKRQALEQKVEADKGKVAFADSVSRTVDNLSVRDYAKVLCDENINIGEKRLYHMLRSKGILDKQNKPYQRYIDNGWFVLKLSTYKNSSTDNVIEYTQSRITGKGQIALRERIVRWLGGEDAESS
ncbi:MAG: BRO family protein [Deferribacterales bacterium]